MSSSFGDFCMATQQTTFVTCHLLLSSEQKKKYMCWLHHSILPKAAMHCQNERRNRRDEGESSGGQFAFLCTIRMSWFWQHGSCIISVLMKRKRWRCLPIPKWGRRTKPLYEQCQRQVCHKLGLADVVLCPKWGGWQECSGSDGRFDTWFRPIASG